jgi:hypothetical protein
VVEAPDGLVELVGSANVELDVYDGHLPYIQDDIGFLLVDGVVEAEDRPVDAEYAKDVEVYVYDGHLRDV